MKAKMTYAEYTALCNSGPQKRLTALMNARLMPADMAEYHAEKIRATVELRYELNGPDAGGMYSLTPDSYVVLKAATIDPQADGGFEVDEADLHHVSQIVRNLFNGNELFRGTLEAAAVEKELAAESCFC